MNVPWNENDPKTYLGDGAYAWYDGQIWIGAERGDGWHVIALDRYAITGLVSFSQDKP
jgi:hypothetical protein